MRKSVTSVFAALVLVLLMVFGFDARTSAQLPGTVVANATIQPSGVDKLDPILQDVAGDGGRSQVIVRAVDAGAAANLADLITQAGGTPGRQLSIVDAQVADVPNASLTTLAASPAVLRIAADRPIAATNERTGPTVGATTVRHNFGYDGSGIGVALIDSGVASTHDDLTDPSGSSRVMQFVDFVGARAVPYDDYGHGTHVAGTILGNGFDSLGRRAGIAPGARLLVLKVLDGAGQGRISNLIAAFDYVLAYRGDIPIRVVNVSIGAGVYESYNTDVLTVAARRVVQSGIVVVAAAGNNGQRNGQTLYGGITAPGNAPWVLTVGASNHNGTTKRSDDTMARFSSRGPTAVDYLAKPDVVAPGVGIESLSSRESSMYTTRASSLLAGTVDPGYLPYLSLSGTSQATPVVTGSVALMLQANPSLTPNAVKAILQYTAQIYADYDALTQGAGFLNTYGAVQLAQSFLGTSAWTPALERDWSRQIIWGNHRVTGGYLAPTANAWATDVDWGAARRGTDDIVWGIISLSTDWSAVWSPWGTSCSDLTCSSVTWGTPGSENVVWGSTCGGADCQGGSAWTSPSGATMIWSVGAAQTITWGTSEGDEESATIVWGTTCDPACNH